MDTTGLEPVTPTMSTWCSNQLSYASGVLTLSHSQQAKQGEARDKLEGLFSIATHGTLGAHHPAVLR